LTQRESKQNEKKEEIIPSSPSTVQRKTGSIPANSVAPIDMTRDITIFQQIQLLHKTMARRFSQAQGMNHDEKY
jgi:hypothetical protein